MAWCKGAFAVSGESPIPDLLLRASFLPAMTDFIILPIDIPTLALSRGFVQLMLGGLLLYLGGRESEPRGTRLWAIGFLLNGVSLFVFPIQAPESWEQLLTVVNHLTLGASTVFFLLGFWRFGQQPHQRWILALLILIPLTSLLAWEIIWPNARMRILCTASGQALFLIALQQSLRIAPRIELARIYQLLRIIVIAYLIVVVWSYASLTGVLPTTADLDIDYHRTLFSVSSLLFMLSLAVSCLALQFGWLAARSADLAMIDWQTGLLNRRGFFRANRTLEEQQFRHAPGASIIVIDIDQFKAINDRFGHVGGDRVLGALADTLRGLADDQQLVARTGGEEFCIYTPGSDQQTALVLAEKIRLSCRDTLVASVEGEAIHFTISAGVCEMQKGMSFEETFINADKALYVAKGEGRDRVRSCPDAALRA